MASLEANTLVKLLSKGQQKASFVVFLLLIGIHLGSSALAQENAQVEMQKTETMIGLGTFFKSQLTQKVDGPNCINNALIELGLNKSRRYTSVAELQVLINSGICNVASDPNDLTYNLGLLTWQGGSPATTVTAHAFIRVSSKLGFEKRGSGKNEPLRYVYIDEIRNDYGSDFQVAYFRCTNLDSWLSKQAQSEPFDSLVKALSAIKILEANIEDQIYGQQSEGTLKSIEESLIHTVLNLEKSLNTSFLSNSERTLKKIILTRTVSLGYQLASLGRTKISRQTSKWLFSDLNIEELSDLFTKAYSK